MPIIVRDLRIRYEVPWSLSNRVAVHGIVTNYLNAASHIYDIKRAGYRIVGIDERFREENERMELDEGWHEISLDNHSDQNHSITIDK